MRAPNPLVGTTVAAIQIARDRQALKFDLVGGKSLVVRVDADCCSYTWVEAVELPALGFPALVVSVEDLELPQDEKPSPFHGEHESLALYGCKIVTDRGEIIIDYRNDSNGYYSGNLDWDGSHFYGGVFKQNVSKQEWCDELSAPTSAPAEAKS